MALLINGETLIGKIQTVKKATSEINQEPIASLLNSFYQAMIQLVQDEIKEPMTYKDIKIIEKKFPKWKQEVLDRAIDSVSYS